MNILDTSFLIELIRNNNLQDYIDNYISIITLEEILRALDKNKRQKIKELLTNALSIINIDQEIVEIYSDIFYTLKNNGKIKNDADIIISATAIKYNTEILTKDKDFIDIKEYYPELKVKII
ncbi:tRNA(fMet)-specific endonuclease VapC [Nanobdella aerobiophila]|uniref:tRNA(fMet)-specific endonuclease VapC n=1 Tax=Nanobdella aerobiophila TaxID=2586965 RepID=A0A915SXW0_9ARCH|nr:type II toxin-antitoxin system VapC family toxin [Nanobdella aerobiophila]BBL45350.1 tRNA(fMet)-specific endonuclease VapC [Nanobdella aerobiophila]